jgi:hypothetical protein
LERALLSGRRRGTVQRWEHCLTIASDPVAIEMLAEEIKDQDFREQVDVSGRTALSFAAGTPQLDLFS